MTVRTMPNGEKYDLNALAAFAERLLSAAGLSSEMAADMSEALRRSDALGHRTHGFAMLPRYLDRIADGIIARTGQIDTMSDSGAAFAWKGNRLPGAWVMRQAIEQITLRSATHPVVTATIAGCSHIGCLQSYLLPLTERGLFVTLTATNPGVCSVAPFGGSEPILTSNPIAYGIPTDGDPILVDQCTSVVSNAEIQAYAARGERTPGNWLVDCNGDASDDASLIVKTPPATIMLLGGEDFGYKGFGFSLMVEALSLAMTGYGRTTNPDRYSQSVFLQAINPEGFAGREAFLRETSDLARRCKTSQPKVGRGPVRLPGQRALAERAQNLGLGVPFEASVISGISAWADRLSVDAGRNLAAVEPWSASPDGRR